MVAERTMEILNQLGMHARAATRFVQTANRFKSDITVDKDGQSVNGKSIMGVLLLVASKGSKIHVRATGDDAEAAIAAIGALVAEKFGED